MLADQELKQLSGPVPGRGRAGDLAIDLMETAQLVVGLGQEVPIAGPARLLSNQPLQVFERLLQSLCCFGGLAPIPVEDRQVEVSERKVVADAGGIEGEGHERKVCPGLDDTRNFANQTLLDRQCATIHLLGSVGLATFLAIPVAQVLKALSQVAAREEVVGMLAHELFPQGQGELPVLGPQVPSDCSNGA